MHRVVGTTLVFGLAALAHAALTWPLAATLALFGGGAAVAFVAELGAVQRGWLVHHVGPKVAGVPLYALLGWTSTVYGALRVALLVTDGWAAVAGASALATTADALTDHRGVAAGWWTYTDALPGPDVLGVPWWNAVGWAVVSGLTAGLAVAAP
ncbi:MAG: carotenoid biosynthesis protein [Halobacteriaceae archaeon]